MGLKEVRARVRINVDVTLNQPWPADVTAREVFDRAAKDAKRLVETAIEVCPESRVVDRPVVTMVMVDDGKEGG